MNAAERRRKAIEAELADIARRLDNVRFYVKQTAPAGPGASPNSHSQWLATEAELMARATQLESEL